MIRPTSSISTRTSSLPQSRPDGWSEDGTTCNTENLKGAQSRRTISMSKKHQPSATQRVKAERVPNEQLKVHRLKKNWTQVYVAAMIGTNDVEVSRWETGAVEPSLYFRE